ncbi:MAG: phosphate ABC transporter permease PtsA [Bacteroidetes bacterium QS_7_67_15]|nr:MAG: phosphate ABC transporter permease PtsA [Bacteroidetes bacterium QS_7_67_15]
MDPSDTTQTDEKFAPRVNRREKAGAVASVVLFLATLFGVVVLLTLLVDMAVDGYDWVSGDFLANYPSYQPEDSGVLSAMVGSLWLIGLTAAFSVPVGVASAVYLEEYASDGWFRRLIQINIANLAGVPSVVYGILGLALFVRFAAMGNSLLAGALTMSLLILPVVIIATQEALRAVPRGMRENAYALGATRWQVIQGHLLPTAAPGILTGVILSLSRAIGETAPLIVIGALTSARFLPRGVMDNFSALPLQIFDWTSRPQSEFQELAAAGIIVLMVALLLMNLSAILLRNYYEQYRPT